MKFQMEEEIKEALSLLADGDPVEARHVIGILFEHDLESKELTYTNRCCTFWIDATKRLAELTDTFEQGERLLTEWKSFQPNLNSGTIYEPALYAMQKGYFSKALEYFTPLFDEKEPLRKAEIYRNAGICYKKLGNFEDAKICLSEANKVYPNLASVVAELADCYALCGEERFGKVLFREAFFLDPEKIDIDYLDSELIKCLIEKTKEKGHSGRNLLLWIPVYGVLGGILNVKRGLSSQEVCRLRQNIYAMESENKDPCCNTDILVPKLLNSYFWLIDHYMLTHESMSKVNDTLLKIKLIDSNVYDAYVK
ncbi:MAG: tetratricopeptide repeat protein [Treponema sp.]|nr:tetratricopeptide repeat protein [Treponema sp.]